MPVDGRELAHICPAFGAVRDCLEHRGADAGEELAPQHPGRGQGLLAVVLVEDGPDGDGGDGDGRRQEGEVLKDVEGGGARVAEDQNLSRVDRRRQGEQGDGDVHQDFVVFHGVPFYHNVFILYQFVNHA